MVLTIDFLYGDNLYISFVREKIGVGLNKIGMNVGLIRTKENVGIIGRIRIPFGVGKAELATY